MTLDQHFALWVTDGSETALNDLMRMVRQRAMSLTHDDDVAQEISLTILTKLDAFKPLDPSAFSRYVSSTIKKHRLTDNRKRIHESLDDGREESAPEQCHSYISISTLNELQKQVATSILAGYSLKDIAGQMNLKESTLRKKLFVLRNEMSLSRHI
jgi:DNA-directed RNA polymerase specialized sigma24 family protein